MGCSPLQASKQNVEPIFDHLLYIMRLDTPALNTSHTSSNQVCMQLVRAEVEQFCDKWAVERTFIAYFRKEWQPKIGMSSPLWWPDRASL